MLYRAALLAVLPLASAQSCGSSGAGTDACKCYMLPCADITAASYGTPIQKQTTNGPVIGRAGTDGIERYFGIPVGGTTAGNNRWKPPTTYTWTSPIQATVEYPCPIWDYPVAGTENCLKLDVMTTTGNTGLPVSFYIHGGGFFTENPFFNMIPDAAPGQKYAYSSLPNGGKTMMIMAHYRLGALGWMAHPGFVDTSLSIPGFTGTLTGAGNYGMMDVLNGLKWVQNNAATFGGDNSKVTAYGESAGGAFIAVLMASTLVSPLVNVFIAESPYISFKPATFSMQARMEMGQLFTYRSLCTTTISKTLVSGTTAAAEASCLRASSILTLIVDYGFAGPPSGLASSTTATTAFDAVYGTGTSGLFTYNTIHCWPVVDGYLLAKSPLLAMAEGVNNDATMVVGHNADEYATFCFYPPQGGNFACDTFPFYPDTGWIFAMYYLGPDATLSEMKAAADTAFSGSKVQQLQAGLYYNDIIDPVEQMSVQMGTDAWFATGNMQVIEALVQATGRSAGGVYHYVFAHDTDPQYPKMGACHGCELTFILGFNSLSMSYLSAQLPPSTGQQVFTTTPGDAAVANAMQGYWASLFYNFNPNTVGMGLPHWSPMTPHDKQTMIFSGDLPHGAAMNPCARVASCRTEQTKDWRVAKKLFWDSSPASVLDKYLPEPTCTAAPSVFTSHKGGASIGLNCSFLPCCKYVSGRRSLLFGMPATGSSACDPMC